MSRTAGRIRPATKAFVCGICGKEGSKVWTGSKWQIEKKEQSKWCWTLGRGDCHKKCLREHYKKKVDPVWEREYRVKGD